MADEQPDLVVSEGAEFAGGLAAERAGSRGAGAPRARPGPCGRPGHLGPLVGPGGPGARADPTAERLVAAPQISYFPSQFDRGSTSAAVTRVRRPGLPRPVEDREPLVYVTFGSEIPGMPMFVPAAATRPP